MKQEEKIISFAEIYSSERNSLTLDQIYSLLDQGIELLTGTDLVNTLSEGGSALFPHAYITKCGDQIAAVAYACLLACQKTGKNQILAIGVMHSLTDTIRKSRQKERDGFDIMTDPCRGSFGPGLPNEELLCKEYSLDSFVFLLEHAAKRSGMQMPKVIMRYPNLISGKPELLPGINELKVLVEESIVVGTSDLCHHGSAYGISLDKVLPVSEKGYDFAYQVIKENLRLLSGNDLLAYRQYSLDSFSDSVEVGQMLNFLLGPFEGHIRDLRLVDGSGLFKNNPPPNWVATTLVELKSIRWKK